MVDLLAVKARLYFPKAGGASNLGIDQSDQLVPGFKAFAVLVCIEFAHLLVENRAWQAFQKIGKSGICVHVVVTELLSRINGFYPSNSVAAIPPELSPKFIPDSSARRRGSIRGSAHHWIPAYAGMTVSREADRW